MNVYITYRGEQVLVSKEVADFLEDDRKAMAAAARQDRRYLSKSRFEQVLDSYHLGGRRGLEDFVIRNLGLKNLWEQIANLSTDEQRLIYKRFYASGTLESIGRDFGISKMAISKRLKKLTEKLRSSV